MKWDSTTSGMGGGPSTCNGFVTSTLLFTSSLHGHSWAGTMGSMMGIPHPYLTAHLPGVGGVIKQSPEDFIVEEVPLYTPVDRGEHTYFEIEKTDLSTPEALGRLSRALKINIREFGYAGLKDRKGITRQIFSIAHVDPELVLKLEISQLKVIWARLHTNKLRIGHLRGNRFRIRVRGIALDSSSRIAEILEVLVAKGVPNYYGPQRFGNRGDAHRVGRAFLRRDDRSAIRRILGHPSDTEHNPHVLRARELFMAGEWQQALSVFPGSYREELRLLQYLIQAGENYEGAKRRLDDSSRKMYFTAYQSFLFNVCLSERLRRTEGDLSCFFGGDLAFLHRNGAVFQVEDPEKETARSAAFEISPSGPIFGIRMPSASGMEGEIEESVLGREGLRAEDFHSLAPRLRLEGGRRPYRVQMADLVTRVGNSDLYLEFFLPKGSYATTVLREITKNEVVPVAFYEDGDEERFALWRPSAPAAPEQGVFLEGCEVPEP